MKVKLGAKDILFPVPAALVVSGAIDKPNIITIAWIGMMSCSPPVLAIGVRKSRHSYGLIREMGDFSVNIPSATQHVETDYCGIVSGRDRDKFVDTGFTAVASSLIQSPIIEQCPFNLECKLIKEVEISEHVAMFGEIVEAHVDEDKIEGEKAKDIDVSKVDPLVYCATAGQYWSLGKKVGDSFKDGKQLIRTNQDQ